MTYYHVRTLLQRSRVFFYFYFSLNFLSLSCTIELLLCGSLSRRHKRIAVYVYHPEPVRYSVGFPPGDHDFLRYPKSYSPGYCCAWCSCMRASSSRIVAQFHWTSRSRTSTSQKPALVDLFSSVSVKNGMPRITVRKA